MMCQYVKSTQSVGFPFSQTDKQTNTQTRQDVADEQGGHDNGDYDYKLHYIILQTGHQRVLNVYAEQ